jgi:hypothetical protein
MTRSFTNQKAYLKLLRAFINRHACQSGITVLNTNRLLRFRMLNFTTNSLVVFPSPYGSSPEYGFRFHKVDGVFSGGKNEREAKIVVEAALAHLRNQSGTTFGIVAMNREQANLIEELFEK